MFDILSHVTVKRKIIFHFNAYFMSCISLSVSTSLMSELCCVGMFLPMSSGYSQLPVQEMCERCVNVYKNIQKH